MQEAKRAVVLFSGGQDSTTCLYWALNQGYASVHAVGFDYGQRHRIELEQARIIADRAGVSYAVLPLPTLAAIGDSALVGPGDVGQTDRAGLPSSFVPGRNLLFLTAAAAYAYKRGATVLVGGMCETDYSGYPDCRRATLDALQQAIELGMEYPIEIVTPLMYLSKKETVELAYSLPGCWEALAESHTCYEGVRPGCGRCPACVLRAKGFAEAGLTDPALAGT
ncbi:MAG TPA: 7-cyano-7-deazaguanine synthase QueC [Chthonomonadaceae bacterium]|nr:7-cyano-7-deazaguanine synthase QueC [Chthonomonadaceae bacterium]